MKRHATVPQGSPGAPSLRAVPYGGRSTAGVSRLLTDRQRQQIARIATREDVAARAVVYREKAPAKDVFICGRGVLKAFREWPSGTRRVAAFMFPDDIFGLAAEGRYVNTAQAIAPSVIHRIPVDALTDLLRQDADLEFQFLCKVIHELRVSQRRAIVLGRKDALGRVAMFLSIIQQEMATPGYRGAIALPMTRADIADYLALSPEAVSRATRRLADQGIVTFDSRHAVRVVDAGQLEKIVVRLKR